MEARRLDNVTPDCETAAGCVIPPLSAAGNRALELHSLLHRLRGLNVASYVCGLYGADRNDLQLLATIEDQLHSPSLHDKEEPPHGDGSDLDTQS